MEVEMIEEIKIIVGFSIGWILGSGIGLFIYLKFIE